MSRPVFELESPCPIPATITITPPAHPEWLVAAQRCEKILHYRNAKIVERYKKYTHNLPPLQAGDTIAIQSPLNHRWNTTGKIITALSD